MRKVRGWDVINFILSVIVLLALIDVGLSTYMTNSILWFISFKNDLTYKIITTLIGVIGGLGLFSLITRSISK